MTRAIHVLRHGEVENPEKILYGRQPGWRLSTRGQEMAQVVADWTSNLDLGAIHASPLQRAQEGPPRSSWPAAHGEHAPQIAGLSEKNQSRTIQGAD